MNHKTSTITNHVYRTKVIESCRMQEMLSQPDSAYGGKIFIKSNVQGARELRKIALYSPWLVDKQHSNPTNTCNTSHFDSQASSNKITF